MPDPPEGEADLRSLARRFDDAERRIQTLIADAPEGDRRELLRQALAILIALRQQDFRQPVVTAYLHAGGGAARAARDLAASLHLKLDRGARTAASSARQAFRTVTADNVDDAVTAGVVAHEDARGTRWGLGAWATMNTETIGRQATSRGVTDAVGSGGKVIVDVGECDYCGGFAGEAIIGTDPLPPFHPSCTCVASVA